MVIRQGLQQASQDISTDLSLGGDKVTTIPDLAQLVSTHPTGMVPVFPILYIPCRASLRGLLTGWGAESRDF